MTPLDWKLERLGALIASIDVGVSVNAEDRLKEDKEIGVLKTSAATGQALDIREHKAVPEKEADKVAVSLTEDTILICRSNTIELVGRSVYVDRDYDDLFLPDTLWKLSGRSSLCSMRWLSYTLRSEQMRKQLTSIATGTSGSMKKISQRNFLKLRIVLPPLREQCAIAAAIEPYDETIQLLEKRISIAKQRKKGLMQRLLTGRMRFPEFANTNKGWEEVRFYDILDIRDERLTTSQNLELYSLTIEDGITPKTERYDRQFLVKTRDKKYKRVDPYDIVYNPPNLRYGAISDSRIKKSVLVSPTYEVLYVRNPSLYDVDFVTYLVTSDRQIRLFSKYAEGTLVERMSVKLDDFLGCRVQVPESIQEQRRIAEVLQTCDREIELLEQKRDALQRQKKGLMQRLLTGRVRVSV